MSELCRIIRSDVHIQQFSIDYSATIIGKGDWIGGIGYSILHGGFTQKFIVGGSNTKVFQLLYMLHIGTIIADHSYKSQFCLLVIAGKLGFSQNSVLGLRKHSILFQYGLPMCPGKNAKYVTMRETEMNTGTIGHAMGSTCAGIIDGVACQTKSSSLLS